MPVVGIIDTCIMFNLLCEGESKCICLGTLTVWDAFVGNVIDIICWPIFLHCTRILNLRY